MKNICKYIAIIFLLGLVSCKEQPKQKAMPDGNAALGLYYKYADNENLTVAYMGDFVLNGNKIDALMLQANDDEDWTQLKSDFGILPELDSLCVDIGCDLPSGNKKVVSVGLGFDTDFIEELGLDTITEPSQVDEERLDKMNAIIAEKLQGIVSTFPMSNSTLPANAIIVGDGPVEFGDDTSLDMEDYIGILAKAVGQSMINDILTENGAFPEERNTLPEGLAFPDSTMRNAHDYGYCGYISAADDSNRTLWLFFYDDQEECNIILTHIKDDILVGQRQQ